MYTPKELALKIEALFSSKFTKIFVKIPPEYLAILSPNWKIIVKNLAIIKEKLNRFSVVDETFIAIFDTLEAIEQGLHFIELNEILGHLISNTSNYVKALNLTGKTFFIIHFWVLFLFLSFRISFQNCPGSFGI